ncbi:DUF3179 domain-containing (seleno)protein [Chryseolinea sp. H1M3-3]|uniref:DUF3179 domain-containing (seleno)protein n=1 Tax=Chryseolinea sp. H1M3-3 TaxID=3034144 RepID=UPI0023ECC690|nr:DUF3179 domain-containing (seleno)protein [Chryseolinea sp. H1M3-3]
MKKLFYFGLLGLGLLEILKVYFIMPMPGISQQIESIDVAYFIHTYRWYFRIAFGIMILAGATSAFRIKRSWLPMLPLLVVVVIVYYFNFKMTAEAIFHEPEKLAFHSKGEYLLGDTSLLIAVAYKGEAKAYPVRYIVYHHQVRDTVGGKPVMVTYCSVCRSGRVFEPVVNGKPENFRLVGMDHFNAMFEDTSTKSWWRQATGEAVAGPLKGSVLPEIESIQVSAGKFFLMYPFGVIMQADQSSTRYYDSLARFERGKGKSKLTGTDSLSWKEKSWVIGIQIDNTSKAYDWNELKEKRIVNDKIGDVPIVLVLSEDNQSFAAFERPSESEIFSIQQDTLRSGNAVYDFAGKRLASEAESLKRINAYQEFWHSWRTFHPETER